MRRIGFLAALYLLAAPAFAQAPSNLPGPGAPPGLLPSNNLSDVASAATSRTNLGVPAASGGTITSPTLSGTTTGTYTLGGTPTITGLSSLNGWAPQFGISDSSSQTGLSTGTGNAVGDQLTLNDGCTPHGVLTVNAVSSGAVTKYNIVNRGSCAAVPSNPVGVLSSTGASTNATFTLVYGPLVAGINFGTLTNNLGNLYLTGESPNVALYGSENSFFGDRAGGAFGGNSSFNAAFGHNACGIGGVAGAVVTGNNNCFGTDAGRNLAAGAVRTSLFGTSAGQNISGADNTGFGNVAFTSNLTSGTQNSGFGASVGATLATGNGNLLAGYKADVTGSGVNDAVALGGSAAGGGNGMRVGSQSVGVGAKGGNASLTGRGIYLGYSIANTNCTTGNDVIEIFTNAGDCSAAAAANEIQIGTGSAATWKATGTNTPSTSLTTIAGKLNHVGDLQINGVLGYSATVPTISSGFGTSPSVVASNGTLSFEVNVGTGGSATSGVIGLPTATTGWHCDATDITTASSTVFLTKQTASSTTTATVGNFNTAGAAAAWVASDKLRVSCFAY
jgi:hypothetical protein